MSGRDGGLYVLLNTMSRLERLCKIAPDGSISARLVQEILDEASRLYDAEEHASVAAAMSPREFQP